MQFDVDETQQDLRDGVRRVTGKFTDDYWRRILPKLDPALIVPTHYDDFFVPLSERAEPIANVRLAELPAEIGAVSRDARIAAIPRVGA